MLRSFFSCCSPPAAASDDDAGQGSAAANGAQYPRSSSSYNLSKSELAAAKGGQYPISRSVSTIWKMESADVRPVQVPTRRLSAARSLKTLTELTLFSYQDLSSATNDFTHRLGKGGFGEVFKGELPASVEYGRLGAVPIAVKCLSDISRQGLPEFDAEVKIFSQIRHKNVVRLLGWCLEQRNGTAGGHEVALVYEFVPNGSLEDFLHDKKRAKAFTWERRFEILKKIGDTLMYLHEQCSDEPILHRDIKCSNILLDDNYSPKLGDFGLSRKVEKGMSYYETQRVNAPTGTRGYMAPELHQHQKFTKETDIYSFGVVLLQVASGKKPLQCLHPNFDVQQGCSQPLIESVWDLHHKKRLLEAVDKRLHHMFNEGEMMRVLLVGLACCHPDPEARLTIKEVVDVLSGTSRMLPCLPHAMPGIKHINRLHTFSTDISTTIYATPVNST